MALVQKHYSEGDYFEENFLHNKELSEFCFLKPEILHSKLSLDYGDYQQTCGSHIVGHNKEKCFEDRMDEFLLERCNMALQTSSLPPLVLSDLYSPKNSPLISPAAHSKRLDPSFIVQSFVDPQLFSDKDIDQTSLVSHEMQLLSPPYSSIQYDKNFTTNLASRGSEKSDQNELALAADCCPQLHGNFKNSIHQLSSQIFSPPVSPRSTTPMSIGGHSQTMTCFNKPPFDQFMVNASFNGKEQGSVAFSNEMVDKLVTFGRFSARKTMVSLETISSFIQGPEKSDGKFVCLYNGCLKRFGRKYNIQSHIQTHLSDRPYSCPICHARFVRHHDLKRHVKIHGDQKPYVCPCGKSFVRTDALKRHRIRGICKGSICEKKI